MSSTSASSTMTRRSGLVHRCTPATPASAARGKREEADNRNEKKKIIGENNIVYDRWSYFYDESRGCKIETIVGVESKI